MIIEDVKLRHLLNRHNPWWADERVRLEVPEVQRQAYEEAMAILKREELRRFAVISGVRRVGKTTVLRQLINSLLEEGVPPSNILYLSFDNPMLKLAGMEQVLRVYEESYPKNGLRYMFFDEIQYADEWSLWIKVLYDMHPEVRLVATGSASPYIEKGARDSGVGRWQVLRMPTLTFREYCRLQKISGLPEQRLSGEEMVALSTAQLQELMAPMQGIAAHWNHYLTMGGFPELLKLPDVMEAQRLLREDVVDKVIQRDIPSLFDVRNSTQLEKLYLYLCLQTGNLTNLSHIASGLGNISVPTVTRYIEFLKDANLIYISEPAGLKGRKTINSRPKIYMADAALRNASLMITEPMEDSTDLGLMVETAVYKHFHNHYSKVAQVGYTRLSARNNKEVDIVVAHPTQRTLLCEVKYKNDSYLKPEEAIMTLCREKATTAALLATKQLNDYGRTETGGVPLLRIPAAALCYLIS